jgi:hypothetical protein
MMWPGVLYSGTFGPCSRARHHQKTSTSDSQKLGMHNDLPSIERAAMRSTLDKQNATDFVNVPMIAEKFSCPLLSSNICPLDQCHASTHADAYGGSPHD